MDCEIYSILLPGHDIANRIKQPGYFLSMIFVIW